VLDSVARTNRLFAVEEGPATGGWAAGLLGLLAEHGLHDLDDAWLLTTGELPIPYSPTLEDAFIPGADAIASSVRERAGIAAAH
jgi:acetoin:2,6-dichlorophenolindophenol oxidoreductase subunit beta